MDPTFADRASFRDALVAAARPLEARVSDGPGESWTVSGGTPACANPNGAPWKAVASLAGDAWGLSPRPVSAPWNRRRAAEIAAFRTRQLEGLIRSPHPLENHERFPFSAGPTLSERATAYGWIASAALAAMALVLVAATLAGIPIIGRQVGELYQRAEVMTRIGADPLPRVSELDGLGLTGRIAAAFLLATPVAFFLGGLFAFVNGLGERFVNVGRFAPWCLVFIGASSLLAFLTRMAIPLAIFAALLMPAAAWFGASLLWGRRRDIAWTTPRPKARLVPGIIIGAVLGLGLLAILIPKPTSNEKRIQETSRFRDRFLLGSPAGRALAHFYYAYTLYAAEPVRPAFSSDPDLKDRQVRTALLIGKFGSDVEALRALNFSVERAKDPEAAAPLIAKAQHDVYFVAGGLTRPYALLDEKGLLRRTIKQGDTPVPAAEGVRRIGAPSNQEEIEKALDSVLRLGGLESMLLELTWLGWTAVYYLGPVFVLVLLSVPLAALLAAMSRNRSTQGIRRMMIGLFVICAIGIGVIFVLRAGALDRLHAVKNLPADSQKAMDVLAAGLRDADPDVRYEAAFQAYAAMRSPTFPRGGLTPQLRAGLRDPSVRVRLWCAAALGLTKDPDLRADLFKALDDEDMLVRYRAAEGLEWLDSKRQPPVKETVARLREVIKTRPWYEGMYALEALRKVDPFKH